MPNYKILLFIIPVLTGCSPNPLSITQDMLEAYINVCKENQGFNRLSPESWAQYATVYCNNGATFRFRGKLPNILTKD